MISQGEVYWVDLGPAIGSAPALRHPLVIVQNDAFNRSRIHTVVGCALTSNMARALSPGNLVLRKGEANLPRRSVVNVSQIVTIDKSSLAERIGTLSRARVREILDGIALLLLPSD